MRLRFEPLVKVYQPFIYHHLPHNDLLELGELGLAGQHPIDQQIGGFDVAGVLRQLFDGVSAIKQLSFLPVDVSYGGHAAAGAHEPRIMGEVPRIPVQLLDVDELGTEGTLDDGQPHLFLNTG